MTPVIFSFLPASSLIQALDFPFRFDEVNLRFCGLFQTFQAKFLIFFMGFRQCRFVADRSGMSQSSGLRAEENRPVC